MTVPGSVQELAAMKRLMFVLATALIGFVGYTLDNGSQRIHVKTVPVTRGNVCLTYSPYSPDHMNNP
jgi:hypothetical protein